MAAKRPTGAYPKSSKKDNAKRVFEAGVKSGKIKSTEAGMTGAMVAKVAGKVIGKAAKAAKDAKSASKAKEAAKTAKIASNSVKVKRATSAANRLEKNSQAKANADTAKSGAWARYSAGQVEIKRQLPAKVVKIKSGKDVKSADSSKRKLASYTPNPGRLPNLIKIDSAKGNSVKKTAYRPNRRTSN